MHSLNRRVLLVISAVAFLCAAVCRTGVCSERNNGVESPLVSFLQNASCRNWVANDYGGGKFESTLVNDPADKFEQFLRLSFKDSKGTLSNSKLFAAINDSLTTLPGNKLYVWCRSGSGKMQISQTYVLNDENDEAIFFSNQVHIPNDNSWHRIDLRLGGYNRQRKVFDKKRLSQIQFKVSGSGSFDIGEIGYLSEYRPLPEARFMAPLLESFPAEGNINIDGKLDETEWRNATTLELKLKGTGSEPDMHKRPTDESRVWISHNRSGLFLAARCRKKDMSTLVATFTEASPDIWRDEVIEFYFDPGRTAGGMIKFAINANGKVGINKLRYPSPKKGWKASATQQKDGWTAEIFIPFSALGKNMFREKIFGFNVKRITYSEEKLAENSFWSTPEWNSVRDYGVLILQNKNNATQAKESKTALGRTGKGEYVIYGTSEEKTAYRLRLTSLNTHKLIAEKTGFVENTFSLPFKFDVAETSVYCLTFVRMNKNTVVEDYFEARFAEETAASWQTLSANSIAVFPEPKKFTLSEEVFSLTDGLNTRPFDPALKFCHAYLKSELKKFYGMDISDTAIENAPKLILDIGLASDEARALLKQRQVDGEFANIRDDGFLLSCGPEAIVVSARAKRGVLYGVTVLADLIKQCSSDVGPVRLRSCLVVDSPAYANRPWHHAMAGWRTINKREPEFYCRLMEQFPLRFRYNQILPEIGWNLHYACAPSMRLKEGWSREDFKKFVKFCNERYVPVIPFMETLGHMGWLHRFPEYEHLREDGNRKTFCTMQPDSYKTLFAFMDELTELCGENPEYKPWYFHAGLDEVRWQTDRQPEEKRCPYCKGIAKNEIFARHIEKLHKHLSGKGMRLAMYADMLAEEHNGLNQFQCSKILDRIPDDTLIFCWSKLDVPAIKRFVAAGLEPWKVVTSYQLDRRHENLTRGRGFLGFAYNWWISVTYHKPMSLYGPLAQAIYANAAWNIYQDDDDSTWRKYETIWGEFLMRNWSRKPLPGATAKISTINISSAVNSNLSDKTEGDGRDWFDYGPEHDLSLLDAKLNNLEGVPVSLSQKNGVASCVLLPKDKTDSVTLNINRKAGSLILLHTADLNMKQDFDTFRLRENWNDPLLGLPIARYTVLYKDGSKESFDALFGWNVARWNIDSMNRAEVFSKYVGDARALWQGYTKNARSRNLPSDAVLYQYEWPNPHPEKEIDTIRLESLGTKVGYALLAVSARGTDR